MPNPEKCLIYELSYMDATYHRCTKITTANNRCDMHQGRQAWAWTHRTAIGPVFSTIRNITDLPIELAAQQNETTAYLYGTINTTQTATTAMTPTTQQKPESQKQLNFEDVARIVGNLDIPKDIKQTFCRELSEYCSEHFGNKFNVGQFNSILKEFL